MLLAGPPGGAPPAVASAESSLVRLPAVAARNGACRTRRGGGERTMYRHGPTCLEGPITLARPAWGETFAEDPPSEFDPEVRADLVARVRRDIAAGNYDTPEKWEAALDRLLEDLEA